MLKFIPLVVVFFTTCATYSLSERTEMERLWGKEIAAFDELNKGDLPKEAILFYGSSSIRLWDNIEADMAPFSVIRRGYGGASYKDAAFYARRVLTPIDYRALVVFFANDIWGGEYDKTPNEIVLLADQIVRTSRRHEKKAPVFIIEITQMPDRAQVIAECDAANAALKAYTEKHEFVHFIPTRDLYVKKNGEIRKELFRSDAIHQNDVGYAIWKDRIKEEIAKVVPIRAK